MSNAHPYIKPITLIFTPSEIIVTEPKIFLFSSYLRIDIIPDVSRQSIQSITIKYCIDCIDKFYQEIIDESFFEGLSRCLVGDEHKLLTKAAKYMYSLEGEEIIVITEEYNKYMDKTAVILDGLIAGIGAYTAFLILNENKIFGDEISVPVDILSGMILTYNMLKCLSLPLLALSKTTDGITLKLVLFVTSFINIWEPLFIDGNPIETSIETRMAVDVISSLSKHVILSLAQLDEVPNVENRLQEYVHNITKKLQMEMDSLVEETRNTMRNINMDSNFDKNIVREIINKECVLQINNILQQTGNSELDATKQQLDLTRIQLQQLQLKLSEESSKLEIERLRSQNMEERIKRLEELSLVKQVCKPPATQNVQVVLPKQNIKPATKVNTFVLKDFVQ